MKTKSKKFIRELKAMRMAGKYNIVFEYKFCRRKGYSINRALEECDLLDLRDDILQ